MRITENCFYVDIEYVIWAIYLAKNITYWKIPVYMYRVGNSGQSVSRENLLKNIKMQEIVALKLVELYEQFKQYGKLTKLQKDVIFYRMERSIRTVLKTYILDQDKRGYKDEIIRFDKAIKKKSKEIYDRLGNVLYFKVIRSCGYSFVAIVRYMYYIYSIRYIKY